MDAAPRRHVSKCVIVLGPPSCLHLVLRFATLGHIVKGVFLVTIKKLAVPPAEFTSMKNMVRSTTIGFTCTTEHCVSKRIVDFDTCSGHYAF